jgi:hypothetical protein
MSMDHTPPFRFAAEHDRYSKVLCELFRFIRSAKSKMFDPYDVGDVRHHRPCDLFHCDRPVDVLGTSPVLPGTHILPTMMHGAAESPTRVTSGRRDHRLLTLAGRPLANSPIASSYLDRKAANSLSAFALSSEIRSRLPQAINPTANTHPTNNDRIGAPLFMRVVSDSMSPSNELKLSHGSGERKWLLSP